MMISEKLAMIERQLAAPSRTSGWTPPIIADLIKRLEAAPTMRAA